MFSYVLLILFGLLFSFFAFRMLYKKSAWVPAYRRGPMHSWILTTPKANPVMFYFTFALFLLIGVVFLFVGIYVLSGV